MEEQRRYTAADWEMLPEGSIELLGGEVRMSPSPDAAHQLLVGRLYTVFAAFCEENGGCALFAPMDVHLPNGDILQPDVLCLPASDLHLLRRKGVVGAPALVVEVLSRDRQVDLEDKYRSYEASGVPEYWIVDPENRTVRQHILSDGRYMLHALAEPPAVGHSPLGVEVNLARLFHHPFALAD